MWIFVWIFFIMNLELKLCENVNFGCFLNVFKNNFKYSLFNNLLSRRNKKKRKKTKNLIFPQIVLPNSGCIFDIFQRRLGTYLLSFPLTVNSIPSLLQPSTLLLYKHPILQHFSSKVTKKKIHYCKIG